MTRRHAVLFSLAAGARWAWATGPRQSHFPRMQALPLPDNKVSLQLNEHEISCYHFGPELNRPFVYPVIGPSGRTLTRMGHPGDPYTHSHHNSIWISYSKVNGVSFWEDHGKDRGHIVQQQTTDLIDSDDRAGIRTKGAWLSATGQPILQESREIWAYPFEAGEWMLVIDLLLKPDSAEVTFDRAGFGPIGVRVAKSLSVYFGGGVIRNSEKAEGEGAIFHKAARWVDYTGYIAPGVIEGLTLFDHPLNPYHPSPFHVREDGWMGAMLSTDQPTVISPGKSLHLRYGIYAHSGMPELAQLDSRWSYFAKLDLHPPYGPPKSARDCLNGNHRLFNVPHAFRNPKECEEAVR
jgi:methane monooxygenase PmoA-like